MNSPFWRVTKPFGRSHDAAERSNEDLKPDKSTHKRLNTLQQNEPASPVKVPKPLWKSVVDENTGRRYYYHRVSKVTTWTKPETFDEDKLAYKRWKDSQRSLACESDLQTPTELVPNNSLLSTTPLPTTRVSRRSLSSTKLIATKRFPRDIEFATGSVSGRQSVASSTMSRSSPRYEFNSSGNMSARISLASSSAPHVSSSPSRSGSNRSNISTRISEASSSALISSSPSRSGSNLHPNSAASSPSRLSLTADSTPIGKNSPAAKNVEPTQHLDSSKSSPTRVSPSEVLVSNSPSKKSGSRRSTDSSSPSSSQESPNVESRREAAYRKNMEYLRSRMHLEERQQQQERTPLHHQRKDRDSPSAPSFPHSSSGHDTSQEKVWKSQNSANKNWHKASSPPRSPKRLQSKRRPKREQESIPQVVSVEPATMLREPVWKDPDSGRTSRNDWQERPTLIIDYVLSQNEAGVETHHNEPVSGHKQVSNTERIKRRASSGVPDRVQIPFLKRRARSWRNLTKRRSFRKRRQKEFEIEVVSTASSTSTLSKSFATSDDSETNFSPPPPDNESYSTRKTTSVADYFEDCCLQAMWGICDRIDPLDNACACGTSPRNKKKKSSFRSR